MHKLLQWRSGTAKRREKQTTETKREIPQSEGAQMLLSSSLATPALATIPPRVVTASVLNDCMQKNAQSELQPKNVVPENCNK
jgi:hypothetical protein